MVEGRGGGGKERAKGRGRGGGGEKRRGEGGKRGVGGVRRGEKEEDEEERDTHVVSDFYLSIEVCVLRNVLYLIKKYNNIKY